FTQSLELNAFRITDPLTIYIAMIVVIAFIIVSPVILYQLWAFISPGLHPKEQKVTLSYIPFSLGLFIIGLLFSYFVIFFYFFYLSINYLWIIVFLFFYFPLLNFIYNGMSRRYGH